jgi:hypothetical protein
MNGFLGSAILEAAIGTSLVYLLLAVFCTTVNEWIEGLLHARAENLRAAIRELLNDQNTGPGGSFLEAFYAHPLIGGLMKNSEHPPYLPVRSFSAAMIDLSTPHVKGPITFADLESGIGNLPDGDVKTSLLALIQNTQGDLGRAQASFEGWFNDAMSRASGWYKRRTQVWTVVLAAGITLSLNADTLGMLRHFWTDPALRLQPAGVLGWNRAAFGTDCWGWFSRVVGWCLTIAAVSLGAPFWFDMLNKFMNFRGAGHKTEGNK